MAKVNNLHLLLLSIEEIAGCAPPRRANRFAAVGASDSFKIIL